MNEPPAYEADLCLAIRKRGKRGESLADSEMRLCERLLGDYPDWYYRTQAEVFNDTVPFGSKARYRE